MAKGENIFKRKDGRWEARYIKSRDITGKIQYGFCYGKTYREAKEKVTKKRQKKTPALPRVLLIWCRSFLAYYITIYCFMVIV